MGDADGSWLFGNGLGMHHVNRALCLIEPLNERQ